MKRIYLFAAVTAIALAACTKTETTGVSEGNLIKFDNAFVGNVTKADIDNNSLTTFWVFGQYDNDGSGTPVSVFDNTQVNGGSVGSSSTWTPADEAWWLEGKSYQFAAYSDGNNTLDIASIGENGELILSNYPVGDNDLVAATATATGPTTGTEQSVPLSFSHLLSKVKFTFTTDAASTYKMSVSDLKFESAFKTGNVTFANNAVSGTWTGVTTGTYEYADIDDFAEENGASVEKYVIPQGNESLTVTFKVVMTDASNETIAEKTFDPISLAYTASGKGTDNIWTPGYSYNYTANINLEDLDSNAKPITFTVTTVNEWEDDTTETELDVNN